jgi:hypothetical protein
LIVLDPQNFAKLLKKNTNDNCQDINSNKDFQFLIHDPSNPNTISSVERANKKFSTASILNFLITSLHLHSSRTNDYLNLIYKIHYYKLLLSILKEQKIVSVFHSFLNNICRILNRE